MVLDEEASGPFKIRAGDVEMRSNQMPGVDLSLQREIRVRLDTTGRTHRRDAIGEIKPRRAERHLRDDDRLLEMARRVEIGALQIIEMVVHADEARHRRLT